MAFLKNRVASVSRLYFGVIVWEVLHSARSRLGQVDRKNITLAK